MRKCVQVTGKICAALILRIEVGVGVVYSGLIAVNSSQECRLCLQWWLVRGGQHHQCLKMVRDARAMLDFSNKKLLVIALPDSKLSRSKYTLWWI